MTREGIDCAANAGPHAAEIAAAGKSFVIRYLCWEPSWKHVQGRAEIDQLAAAGLDVGFVWETTANAALAGAAGGAKDGAEAVRQLRALGAIPDLCPTGEGTIYWAVDFAATAAQADGAIADYGRAFAAAAHAAGYRAADYGSASVNDAEAAAGAADEGAFGTYAWSGGKVSGHAALYQWRNGQTLGGLSCDFTRQLRDDAGLFRFSAAPHAPTTVMVPVTVIPTTQPAPGPADLPLTAALPSSTWHKVRVWGGGSLSAIAVACGVPLLSVEQANPGIHNPNLVHPGQVVVVPPAPAAHTPAPTLGTPAAQPQAGPVTPATPPASAQGRTAAPAATPRATYTVKRSDSDGLQAVCARLGIGSRWVTVAQLSGIRGPRYTIHPGDVLVLPAGVAAPSAPASHAAPAGTVSTTIRTTDHNGLSSVSARTGVSLARILLLNPQFRPNPNLVYPGQSVRLK